MEKMEKLLVRMEKFPVRVEKVIVYSSSWQDWSCYLEAVTRGLRQDTKTCITLLIPFRNVISERRMLQNRGEKSRFKMEKNLVKMVKNLVRMEKNLSQFWRKL